MNVKVNANYLNLKKNYLFSEIARRVAEYSSANPQKRIVRLGIGDVTLPLTPSVTGAMAQAVAEMGKKETFQGYPPSYGYDFLLKAISAHYASYGADIGTDEIFVSDGAKSDAGNITDIFGSNPVLITDPVYPVYFDSNIMAGNAVTFIPANRRNGFLPPPPREKTAGALIYLCSPNNPTGAVYDKAGLKAWVDYANDTGSLIIYDSAYEAYIKGDLPHTIYQIEGARDCAVEICSFSKTAGFTGVRCSWTVVPRTLVSGGVNIAGLWARRQATKFNGVPYIVQRGAEAALSERGYAECMDLVGYYMENARIISELLTRKGIYFTGGECAPYIWMQCPGGLSSWGFFDMLLQKAQVVGTPGAGFGANGEGYFRLTAFGTREDTYEAVRRLETVI